MSLTSKTSLSFRFYSVKDINLKFVQPKLCLHPGLKNKHALLTATHTDKNSIASFVSSLPNHGDQEGPQWALRGGMLWEWRCHSNLPTTLTGITVSAPRPQRRLREAPSLQSRQTGLIRLITSGSRGNHMGAGPEHLRGPRGALSSTRDTCQPRSAGMLRRAAAVIKRTTSPS